MIYLFYPSFPSFRGVSEGQGVLPPPISSPLDGEEKSEIRGERILVPSTHRGEG